MKKRYIIIPAVCVIFFFLMFQTLKFINTFTGSYHYAEWYVFEESEENLIAKITDFKHQNSEYKVIRTLESGETKESIDEYFNSYYACLFYLKDKEIILSCRTHDVIDNNQTIMGLVAIQYKYSSSWRLVNKELSRKENAEIKKLFETEIVNKLGKWQRKPKSWLDYFK